MDKNIIRDHQIVMLGMLKEFDRICKKYNIKYSLFAGTALGAVREKGFIPWDDDLDIIMLRSQYLKFLEIAENELDPDIYYLQKEFSEHWPNFFTKLRKNNTAFIEKVIPKDKLQHQGIYIDIFPCDNLAENKFIRNIQFYSSKIVIAKSLSRKGYLTDNIFKKIFMFICKAIPLNPFLKITKRLDDTKSEYVHSFLGASSKYKKSIYQRKWFEETKLMKFEDAEFPVSVYYDELLTVLYGDYMVVPSPEERACKKHAVIIDIENSYEKYVDWQANQKFHDYTRSIR